MAGKYETQGQAMGDSAAADIAAINKKPVDASLGLSGAMFGAGLDVKVAAAVPPPPPPPPAAKMIAGSSQGSWPTIPAMVTALGIAHRNGIRCFNAAQAAAAASFGCAHAFSDDSADGRGVALIGVKPGTPQFAALVTKYDKGMPNDVPGNVAIAAHEFDINGNDYVKTAAIYLVLNQVVAEVNKTRKNPIQTYVVTTGMVYDTTAYEGLAKIPCDGIGADNYARKHWDTMAGFGKRIGRPVGVFENGIKAQTNASLYKDAYLVAALDSDWALAVSLGFSHFYYWPNGGNALFGATPPRPATIADLKGKIAAARA